MHMEMNMKNHLSSNLHICVYGRDPKRNGIFSLSKIENFKLNERITKQIRSVWIRAYVNK